MSGIEEGEEKDKERDTEREKEREKEKEKEKERLDDDHAVYCSVQVLETSFIYPWQGYVQYVVKKQVHHDNGG